MKKISVGNLVYEVAVSENYCLESEVALGDYRLDTIAYAVEHFFTLGKNFSYKCARESWKARLAKGKEKSHGFSYIIPAVLMELPGNWVRISGKVGAAGFNIKKVELLEEHPCFTVCGALN